MGDPGLVISHSVTPPQKHALQLPIVSFGEDLQTFQGYRRHAGIDTNCSKPLVGSVKPPKTTPVTPRQTFSGRAFR